VADISIRGLDDQVRDRLRIRAAEHGRSMEAEIRVILAEAVDDPSASKDLFSTLIERFSELGGVDLDIPSRRDRPRVPDLAE